MGPKLRVEDRVAAGVGQTVRTTSQKASQSHTQDLLSPTRIHLVLGNRRGNLRVRALATAGSQSLVHVPRVELGGHMRLPVIPLLTIWLRRGISNLDGGGCLLAFNL